MPNIRQMLNLESEFLRASASTRYDAGRSQRESVPLDAHAEVTRKPGGTDPLAILAQQNEARLSDLLPLRYGRMSKTPFTYLRGAAVVMASDLAAGPRTGLTVELCGDAHLGNFRWYRAPGRELVFDLNDFDETLPGPFEWDVKRLAASITVAGRNNGLRSSDCLEATRSAMREYRQFIAVTSELSPLDLHYYRFNARNAYKRVQRHGKKQRKWKEQLIAKAGRKDSIWALKKLTAIVDGHRVIVPDPPRITRVEERLAVGASAGVSAFFEKYRESLPLDRRVLLDRFSLVDVAMKVVGVGSVGTRCLITLLEAGDGTPLFLQFKQAVPSVLEPWLGASVYEQAGQRVVEGQRLIQATSDVFLGWSRWNDGSQPIDFYFRQLWDGKGKIAVEQLGPRRLAAFAGICGKALAFAHARSGDAMMIRGYIGDADSFDDIMVEFAEQYSARTERDHAQLIGAINDGVIDVDLEQEIEG